MIVNVRDIKRVATQIFILLLSILGICLGFKLAVFYMPFLIAFALYLLIEPVIRFCMNKFNLKRKTSSLLILFVVIAIIIGILAWGIATIISEASNLLNNLNEYVNIIQNFITEKTSKFDFNKIQMSKELTSIINSSSNDLISHISEIAKDFFTGLLNKLTSLPTIGFYAVITIITIGNMLTIMYKIELDPGSLSVLYSFPS